MRVKSLHKHITLNYYLSVTNAENEITSYYTNILTPAFDYLKSKNKRAQVKQKRLELNDILEKHTKKGKNGLSSILNDIDKIIQKINNLFDDIAMDEAKTYKFYPGVIHNELWTKHRDLPAYDHPRGWMTKQAFCDTLGNQPRTNAVNNFLSGTLVNLRSAPVGGYEHLHINSNASNIMSIIGTDKIVGFSTHMDTSKPGKIEAGKMKNTETSANSKGWVWITVINGQLRRLRHP